MAKAQTLTIEVDTSEATRKLEQLADQIRSLPALPVLKLEAVVTLPNANQVWVRFAPDGTPYADFRAHAQATWTPVGMIGGSVEVAP